MTSLGLQCGRGRTLGESFLSLLFWVESLQVARLGWLFLWNVSSSGVKEERPLWHFYIESHFYWAFSFTPVFLGFLIPVGCQVVASGELLSPPILSLPRASSPVGQLSFMPTPKPLPRTTLVGSPPQLLPGRQAETTSGPRPCDFVRLSPVSFLSPFILLFQFLLCTHSSRLHCLALVSCLPQSPLSAPQPPSLSQLHCRVTCSAAETQTEQELFPELLAKVFHIVLCCS